MVKASDFKDKETSHYFNPVILGDNLELSLVKKKILNSKQSAIYKR